MSAFMHAIKRPFALLRIGLGPRLVLLVIVAVLISGGLVGAVLIQQSRNTLREQIIGNNLATHKPAAGKVAGQSMAGALRT